MLKSLIGALIAWAEDRALRLILFLLDPTEPEEDLAEYAECIAELIDRHPILLPLKRRLVAAPLPGFVDAVRVHEACRSVEPVRDLFEWILSVQTLVGHVSEAYEAVPVNSFSREGREEDKVSLRARLVEEGAFLDAVITLSDSKDLGFVRQRLASKHRAFSSAIAQWFAGLQGDLKRLPRSVLRHKEPEADDEYPDSQESPHFPRLENA